MFIFLVIYSPFKRIITFTYHLLDGKKDAGNIFILFFNYFSVRKKKYLLCDLAFNNTMLLQCVMMMSSK